MRQSYCSSCCSQSKHSRRLALLACALLLTGCRDDTTGNASALSDAESHQQMVKRLDEIQQRASDENIFVGDRQVRELRKRHASLGDDAPRLRRWLFSYQLAKSELRQGNESDAIGLFKEAHELIADNPTEIKAELLRQFYFDTAVAYLRLGETENCCQRNAPGSCIVPIEGDAIHTKEEGSREAIHWLTKVFQATDENESMHLGARWLLNLAHMTLGEYPEKVAQPFLIPGIDRDAKRDGIQPWKNIAESAGVANFSMAGGAIADDFDNDGDIDLVTSSWDPKESLRIYLNDGSAKFTDVSKAANVDQIRGGLNLTQTDYNNDGWIDIFVLRGGWLGAAGQHPNSLLRNNGDGTFSDVTVKAGLAEVNYPTQTAGWSDFDLDGDLDVYIGNESSPELTAPSQLFRNNGDGTFTDIAKSAGVTNDRLAKAVTWGDVGLDGRPDLYVSNYRGANRLYLSQSDGTFNEVAETWNVAGPDASFPTWFFDANQDGNLDLFVAAYSGGIAEIAASHLNKPYDKASALPRLYLSQVKSFENAAEQNGLGHPTHPMGSNFADLNADGYPDIYLGTGWPEYHELMPNAMYLGGPSAKFVDVTNAARVGHLQKGHAVAIADFDNDGDLDVFEQMGGFVPGDKYRDVLFENPAERGATQNNWIKVKLVGKKSNRPGIGSKISVHVSDQQGDRVVYRTVNSGGSFGANPLEQYIGIGSAKSIEKIVVNWTATNQTSTVKNPKINERIVIEEE